MAMARFRSHRRLLHRHIRLVETLAFEEVRSPPVPSGGSPALTASALVLHGLLGSARNWRSFTRNLTAQLHAHNPDVEWKMILVDLRNHGRSTEVKGLEPPHDLVNAARDLADLVKARGFSWPDVVIGHSLGGKVALEYATSCCRGEYGRLAALPKQLWVLDSVPGEVSQGADEDVRGVLDTLSRMPSTLPSQRWVVEYMVSSGFSKPLSEWIASNLKKSNDHMTWAFDLQAAIQMFDSYRERSYWPLLEKPPSELEIAIVRAEESDRWEPSIVEKLEAISRVPIDQGGKVVQFVLPNSGHWVHVDNPKGLLEIMAPNFFMPSPN